VSRIQHGVGRMRLRTGVIAHFVASYGVMLALFVLVVARGAAAAPLAWSVLFAPVVAPLWLFVVTPMVVVFGRTLRLSAQSLPGVDNAVVGLVGWIVYFGLFVVTFRLVYGRRVRALRRLLGQCLGCGYDLRGTPGRCPECGHGPGGN
jgi:hypothetical protein